MSGRNALLPAVRARGDWMLRAAQRLIAVPSPNPPLDTRAVAAEAAALVKEAVPDIAVEVIVLEHGVTNLLAVLRGRAPGRRVVFSGHLDTYPLLEELPWTVDPLGGLMRDGRIYGRGAADMKGGIAAAMTAFAALAECRQDWAGEVVLALAGDEESMGALGTRWLLDNRPAMRGDAVLIADVGSPDVLRFGEKGFLWFEVEAAGKPAHGAHVHLGVNAAERLLRALDAVLGLRGLPVPTPPAVAAAIARAAPISERLSGAGESEVLQSVTVNIGQIEAGPSPNLVPARAWARGDIRLPVGVPCAAAEAFLHAALDPLPGIAWRVLRRAEPAFTEPSHAVVQAVARAAAEVRGAAPAVNMRVGGSDARLFRAEGLPTVVYGPTPFGMGGPDESVLIADLAAVAEVHALAAWEMLNEA
jgi:acetylornithine deacetylase/succinyl-diaminopimelate desuccinylase-like protein